MKNKFKPNTGESTEVCPDCGQEQYILNDGTSYCENQECGRVEILPCHECMDANDDNMDVCDWEAKVRCTPFRRYGQYTTQEIHREDK